jgi:hypothetical protein
MKTARGCGTHGKKARATAMNLMQVNNFMSLIARLRHKDWVGAKREVFTGN